MNPHDENDDFAQGAGIEPTPGSLAHWLEEQYAGDDRFDAIDIEEPGPLEGETVRVVYRFNASSLFFVAVMEDDGLIRIGMATADEAVSEAILEAVEDSGLALTEFVAEAMGAQDELEHEIQHIHDELFYFFNEVPYQREEDLTSNILRDEVIYYLDGYITALADYLE
jgi:hypothetical protein